MPAIPDKEGGDCSQAPACVLLGHRSTHRNNELFRSSSPSPISAPHLLPSTTRPIPVPLSSPSLGSSATPGLHTFPKSRDLRNKENPLEFSELAGPGASDPQQKEATPAIGDPGIGDAAALRCSQPHTEGRCWAAGQHSRYLA